MSVNQAQIDFWNGPTGQKWAKHQTDMDRNLADIGRAAMALAEAKPGERVLEIGSGNGTLSLALAEAMGPSGDVLGVDVSQPMLALARARAPNIRFVEADAASYPFVPDRDLIFSRFGVMFFADPVHAFVNIRKAAKRNGRLAFVCWRKVEDNEWAMRPWLAAKPFLSPQPPAEAHAPGPFAFADKERTRGILAAAGFRDIAIDAFDGRMRLGNSAEQAAIQLTSLMGPASRALKNADDQTRAKARAAIAREMAALKGGGPEIAPGTACWLVSAKA